METSRLRLGIVGVIGFLVPLWWTWSVSKLIYGLFVFGGSPERPSPFFAWATFLVPSIVVGLIGGGIVTALAPRAPLHGWVVFAVSAVLGTIISLLALGSLAGLPELLESVGTWTFVAGTLGVPVLMQVVRRRDG